MLEIDESLIDGVDEKIGEIGQKIQLRLKETVFKKSFRDLAYSDYMKTRSETLNLNCPVELSENCPFDFETEFNRLNAISSIFDETYLKTDGEIKKTSGKLQRFHHQSPKNWINIV